MEPVPLWPAQVLYSHAVLLQQGLGETGRLEGTELDVLTSFLFLLGSDKTQGG